jgi:multicomponent Na+:H+ antiporter subunit C
VHTLLAFVVGAFYAAGIYMLMRRSIVKVILGLALLGHAANLLIFSAGRLTRVQAPLVPLRRRGADAAVSPTRCPRR